MAIEPVVKTARLPALGHSRDVDDSPKEGKTIHYEVWAQRQRVASAKSHPAQVEEEEAEQGLPGKRPQAPDARAGSHCTKDAVAWQTGVGQKGNSAENWGAGQRAVDDWKSTCREQERRSVGLLAIWKDSLHATPSIPSWDRPTSYKAGTKLLLWMIAFRIFLKEVQPKK